jgi:hypothetical protein
MAVAACPSGSSEPPPAARGSCAINHIAASASVVGRYGRFELSVDLSASYDSPYDPEQIDLEAKFTTPSGGSVVVPGFYYQAYRRMGPDPDSPILEPVGKPCWKVRFAPSKIGRYRCVVALRNRFAGRDRRCVSAPVIFRCVRSASAGSIRVAPAARGGARYFAFDSGAPFYPVGQNIQNDWVVYRHTRLLADGGANCARVWMFCHWTWLEWTPRHVDWAGPGHWLRELDGAGVYSQGIAWMADEYLRRCERDGVYLMICLNAALELTEGSDPAFWAGHPYNRANGGFLDKPEQYWTDPRARRLARNRLRYIAARYGCSTAVWAWEFWNELGEAGPDVTAWHREMGDYLRSMDPGRHLRTVSTWQQEPEKLAPLWRLPQIDFTQSHIYAPSPAFEPSIAAFCRLYGKPHVIGEGGGLSASPADDSPNGPCTVDPEGIDFHNSLWLPATSGAAGGTLPWHWRQRIEPLGLSPQLGALARFLRAAPPGRPRPAAVELRCAPCSSPARLSPAVVVPLGPGYGVRPQEERFTLRPGGAVAHAERIGRMLFGKWHPEWRRPPTFVVRFLAPGRFSVHVGDISHGVLTISLDGRELLRNASFDIDRKTIDRDFGIDVPAGDHEIRLDNAGGDWIETQYFVSTNVRDAAQSPDLEAHALRTDGGAMLWLRNRLNEWAFRAAGAPLRPTGRAEVTLRGLPVGRYRVEWWDTYRGVVVRRETARAGAAGLTLAVGPVERDTGCILRRSGR